MSFLDNPELRRLAWLELTPARLVAMPVVLSLLLLIGLLNNASASALASGALTVYLLLTHFWGLRQAADSIAEEFRARTWDLQRMSVLRPGELAVGKLLGANLFTWYGGLLCLAAFAYCYRQDASTARAVLVISFVIGSALLLQGTAMFLTLLSPGARSFRAPYLLLLGVVALPLAGGIFPLLIDDHGRSIHWYGPDWPLLPFAAASIWVFALWAVLGVIRLMAGQLQVRTTPAAFCAFLLFVSLYASGFVIGPDLPLLSALVFMLLTTAVTFTAGATIAAWFDQRDALRYKRIGLAFAGRRAQRLLEELPTWSAALVIAAVLAFVLVPGLTAVSARPAGVIYAWLDETGNFGPFSPAALVLLAMRDVAFLQGLSFTRSGKRADLAAAVYLLLAYLLLPALLSVFNARMLILPNPFTQGALAVLVFAIHLAVVLAWVRRRWRGLVAADASPPAAPGQAGSA